MDVYRASVTIQLKEGILDPESAAIQRALEHLGYPVLSLRGIRGFVLELEGESPGQVRERVEEMCRRLLANPVIHKYEVRIERVKT